MVLSPSWALNFGCFPRCPQQFPVATDETAVADRAGGGTAVDHHRNDPLNPGDMDLSVEEHVPKVHRSGESRPRRRRICAIDPTACSHSVSSIPRLPDQPGAEAVHDHEAAGEVDGGRAPPVPGGPAAARSRLAPHTRYVPAVRSASLSLSLRGRSFFVRTRTSTHALLLCSCVRACRAHRHQDRRANPEPRAEVLHQGRSCNHSPLSPSPSVNKTNSFISATNQKQNKTMGCCVSLLDSTPK